MIEWAKTISRNCLFQDNIHDRKKWPWPPHSNNSKSCFERSGSMCEKKIRAAFPQHQAGGLGVWMAMEVTRLTTYISTFCSPKNHGFRPFYGNLEI